MKLFRRQSFSVTRRFSDFLGKLQNNQGLTQEFKTVGAKLYSSVAWENLWVQILKILGV